MKCNNCWGIKIRLAAFPEGNMQHYLYGLMLAYLHEAAQVIGSSVHNSVLL